MLLIFLGINVEDMEIKYGLTLINIFMLLVFNPIAEEFLFRKLILDILVVNGVLMGIVVSSIFFAIPHAISQGIRQVFSTFVLVAIWAYVRIKTKSLLYPILLHSLSNLWGMFLPLIVLKLENGPIIYFAIWIVLIPVLAAILVIKEKENILKDLVR